MHVSDLFFFVPIRYDKSVRRFDVFINQAIIVSFIKSIYPTNVEWEHTECKKVERKTKIERTINTSSAHTIHILAKDMDATADYSRSVSERMN
jgi:hypothetical protein